MRSLTTLLEAFKVDIVPHLQRLAQKTSNRKQLKQKPDEQGAESQRVGLSLYDVYQGEQFASILETMACFRACPGNCSRYVLCLKDAPNGCFCR